MTKKAPVRYYKVINTKTGHNGLKYHLGLNIDPNARPLNQVGSCERGAIYFTDLENLQNWMYCGDSIAWIIPKSRVKKDERGKKWKAHKIYITKILPKQEALVALKVPLNQWYRFGVNLTEKIVLESKQPVSYKILWLRNYANTDSLLRFLLKSGKNSPAIQAAERLHKRVGLNWHTKHIKVLAQKKMWNLIDTEELQEVARGGNMELFLKIIKSNPKKYMKFIKESL